MGTKLEKEKIKLIIDEAKKQIFNAASNGGNVLEIAIEEIEKLEKRIYKV